MRDKKSSLTAIAVAIQRAEHQILDHPRIFEDPLAARLAGVARQTTTFPNWNAPNTPNMKKLRGFVAARSRYAEDALAQAVSRAVKQYVIMGAGLDTFAYRNPYSSLRVFEVDYPATQEKKQELLVSADIEIPASLTYASIDFEKDTLAEGLLRAGLDFSVPTFFSWLGVSQYLTHAVVMNTLQFASRLVRGSEIVFDYVMDPAQYGPEDRALFDELKPRLDAFGEPFITFLERDEITHTLVAMGYNRVESVEAEALRALYLQDRTDGLTVPNFGRLMHACT